MNSTSTLGASLARTMLLVLATCIAGCGEPTASSPGLGSGPAAQPSPPPAAEPADAFLSGEVRLYGGLGELETAAVHVVARGVPGTPLVLKLPVTEGVLDESDGARVLAFALDGRSGMLAIAVPRTALPKTFAMKIAYSPDGLVSGIVDELTIERPAVPLDSHDLRYELRPGAVDGAPAAEVGSGSERPPRRRVALPEPFETGGDRAGDRR